MAHQDAFPARDRSVGVSPFLTPAPVSRSSSTSTHRSTRAKRRARLFSALLPLLLVSGLLSNWAVLIPTAFAAAQPTSAPGHNTYQQFLQQSQQQHAQHTPFQRPAVPASLLKAAAHPRASATTLKQLPSVEPATMQDQVFTLDDSFVLHRPAMRSATTPARVRGTAIPAGTTPLLARGSDGRLEVELPRGSLDFTHASLADGSAPVGQLLLQIHQVSGHFIEAECILGTYQLQIVDSQGHVVQSV